jgi:hypothetical protein
MSEMSVNPSGASKTGEILEDLGSGADNVSSDYESTVDLGGTNPFYGTDKFGQAFGVNWESLGSLVSPALGVVADASRSSGGNASDTGSLYQAADDRNTEMSDEL